MKYLKLVGLKPDAFETTVEKERNYPDTKEGKECLEKEAGEWKAQGLVCVSMTM